MKQRQEPKRQRQRHRDLEAETEIFGVVFCVCVWGRGGVGRRRVAVLCAVVVLSGRDGAGRE